MTPTTQTSSTASTPDVFQAIAAPIRRDIMHTLAMKGDQSITDLATDYAISRQAVTRHIRVLQHNGIVSMQKQGREQICTFHAEALQEVYQWIRFYEQFWETKLDSLGEYLSKKEENE